MVTENVTSTSSLKLKTSQINQQPLNYRELMIPRGEKGGGMGETGDGD